MPGAQSVPDRRRRCSLKRVPADGAGPPAERGAGVDADDTVEQLLGRGDADDLEVDIADAESFAGGWAGRMTPDTLRRPCCSSSASPDWRPVGAVLANPGVDHLLGVRLGVEHGRVEQLTALRAVKPFGLAHDLPGLVADSIHADVQVITSGISGLSSPIRDTSNEVIGRAGSKVTVEGRSNSPARSPKTN
jgi:hypothetical protein